jgi:hypothetical protein
MGIPTSGEKTEVRRRYTALVADLDGCFSYDYQAIADNLETFLERLRAEGHELPWYVVRRRLGVGGRTLRL